MGRMNDGELRSLLGAATPGPWRVFGKKTGKVISENAPGFVEVCEAGDFKDRELVPFNGERWNADAALIALSPALAAEVLQLREALTDLLDACDQFGVSGGNIAAARAALSADAMNREDQP